MKTYKNGLFASALGLALGACASIPDYDFKTVYPSAETVPVADADDAADDPAIWVHPTEPAKSLILGTNKRAGLLAYNLQGEQVAFIDRGRLNNVDLRDGIGLGDQLTTVAVASNRTHKSFDVFTISPDGQIEFVFEQKLDLEDPYGICMLRTGSKQAMVYVNGKNGEYQQWRLNPSGELKPKLIARMQLDSQPEGCAAADRKGILYIGEENKGLWAMPANLKLDISRILVDDVKASPYLKADVEGMDIYHGKNHSYLVVSSQGNNSFAVYQLLADRDLKHVGSFRIGDTPEGIEPVIDGAQETDGLAVTSANLGGEYSQGLLVVQDGKNTAPKANQNFTLVPWARIAEALGLAQ